MHRTKAAASRCTPGGSPLAEVGGQPLDVYGASMQGTVRVGTIVLANPRLDFLDRPVGNLGFRFLKNLVVTFDPKNRRVQFHNAA